MVACNFVENELSYFLHALVSTYHAHTSSIHSHSLIHSLDDGANNNNDGDASEAPKKMKEYDVPKNETRKSKRTEEEG